MSEHGTYSAYVQGCRCSACAQARRDYASGWRAEQRRLVAVGKAFEKFMKEQNR
jgi:hypothetical protein